MMTALYRRYRPDTFAEVIGQDHVTKALEASLANGRINHAYLFSGPRGCGKTTSARIMARCLNCVEGPTPTPCGKCDSCRDLATGGSGSLDVVEIDAASNGGVDDARELRERATFAPVRDRFKIFILDEAHMVTAAGFNALLKLVEEPPEHIKFIFATTDPDKVIGTIRSRTHHYPFRLVAPEILRDYLADLCHREGVTVEDGVLGLAVRAGGGSVRDSLSILDQLMAGEAEPVLHYDRAVALLGYTDSGLLQGLVDALVDGCGADAYGVVDRMIQTGHDPRRFVEDLLQYLRNLVILRLAGTGAEAVLGDIPAVQLSAMRAQVAARPPRTWTRAAEQVNAGLSEMGGASSPRLSLELLVAQLLLEFGVEAGEPAASLGVSGGAVSAPAPVVPVSSVSTPVVPAAASSAGFPAVPAPAAPAAASQQSAAPVSSAAPVPVPAAVSSRVHEVPAPSPQESQPELVWEFKPTPWGIPGEAVSGKTTLKPAKAALESAIPASSGNYEAIRSRWGEIMDALKAHHSTTESLLSTHGQLQGMRGNTVEIAFQNQGMLRAFGERHVSALARVITQVTGQNVVVTGVVAGFGDPGSPLTASQSVSRLPAPPDSESLPPEPDYPPEPDCEPEPPLVAELSPEPEPAPHEPEPKSAPKLASIQEAERAPHEPEPAPKPVAAPKPEPKTSPVKSGTKPLQLTAPVAEILPGIDTAQAVLGGKILDGSNKSR
ncbi:DNA polymerase III subunit gamma and tau [Mobiluncus mulieris]|uniref:DNA polymerase III subunit gamma/tau n=1 Tax=Mobiluncus mulieris TaxID=2052 RepID=A0A7Y0UTI6_9ACTO|nr:DNA polymerase III subunit gamma and tau [Mobiluncus mulieris]NMX03466.1 DNA polymerase III subunit gamma and tau [Mobiluncus mulieris]NMX10759.1 DNA polymerase III subunit gamma and tau [Mobiluncus mulieris]